MTLIRCSICSLMTDDKHAHNASPVNKGRCCKSCNVLIVIPERIARAREVTLALQAKLKHEREKSESI